MKKETMNKISILTVFAIAMGFLEAVIVIYLRKLFLIFSQNDLRFYP